MDVTRSSFTHFISDTVVPLLTRGPVTYRSVYATAVEGDAEAAAKAIPVGDTQARMLLLAGSDDQMWDSAAMAEAIRAARPEGTAVRVFDGAGHVWGGGPVIDAGDMRINVGGTVEANAQVAEKGSALILEQLEAWHGTGY
ncbi:MAG: hypothetical protein E7001_02725 [Coriobacteriaceae bacterium]|nr:hypothetical protein [Coriobacteriaceae bacterium]